MATSKPRLVKGGGVASAPTATTQAIQFGGLALGADGLTVTGRPVFGDFEAAMRAALYLEQQSPWWVADLLVYGRSRPDWEGLIDAVVDARQFTAATVSQYHYVAKSVPAHERVEGLSFSHHEAVASLPSPDKKYYLAQAKTEHLSVSALKQAIRKAKGTQKVISGQASDLAKAHHDIVLAAADAATACREIPLADAKDAEAKIDEARTSLDMCAEGAAELRKLQGRT